jgi:hypothetical protein
MKASPLVALTSAIILIGCAGYGRPETPIAVECLDGNYIRLAKKLRGCGPGLQFNLAPSPRRRGYLPARV